MSMRLWGLAAGAAIILAAGAVAAAGGHEAHQAVHEPLHEAVQGVGHTALNTEVTLDSGGLRQGRRSGVMVRFTHADGDGAFPLFTDELELVHDHPIHVMAIEPSMTDYHHEHPVQVEKEGNYAFFIKPRTPCSYKMWAQVHFKGGITETVTATIPGSADCADRKPDRAESLAHDAGGYSFAIDTGADGLKKGKDSILRMIVTDKDGMAVEALEPLMGAFAHLVGFHEDYEHIAHIHPEGESPGKHERGGPELTFHYMPERAGSVKLFAQVKIGGRVIFAPFTVTVAE